MIGFRISWRLLSLKDNTRKKDLVIDDMLHAIEQFRLQFGLQKTDLNTTGIKLEAQSDWILQRLIADITAFAGGGVYTRKHPLVKRLGPKIYERRVRTSTYTGYRVHPDSVHDVLRLVFDECLKTITQLPVRDQKFNLRKVKSLGARLSKLTEALRAELSDPDLQPYFAPDVDKARLWRLPDEMACAGRLLAHLPAKPPAVMSTNSPNPQVRLALSLTSWVEAASGGKRYEALQEVIGAIFVAAGKNAPAWASRLAIEMHHKRRRGRAWFRRVSQR